MHTAQLGTLAVVVLKARNLKDNHTFYKQDPYVVVRLHGFAKVTNIDPSGGQHPVWDEEFHLPIYESPSSDERILKVSCFAKEKKVDKMIGEGQVDVRGTLRTGEFDDWITLKQNNQVTGEIYLELTFYSKTPPVQRRPSKLAPSERLWRPPPTLTHDHSVSPSPADTDGRSRKYNSDTESAPIHPAEVYRIPSILQPANPRSSPDPLISKLALSNKQSVPFRDLLGLKVAVEGNEELSSRVAQEKSDGEFARKLAESEGIDIGRLEVEERDAELAREIAAGNDNHFPRV